MLRTAITVVLFAGVAFMGTVSGEPAGDKTEVKSTKKGAKSSKAAKTALDLSTANKLAQIGIESKSPEILLAAARIIGLADVRKVDSKDSKTEFQSKAGKDVSPEAEAKNLIEQAITFAKKTKQKDRVQAIMTLAEQLQKEMSEVDRGRVGGPRYYQERTLRSPCDKHDTFYVRYRGGEQGVFVVNNLSNHGDIDLYVYNQNGQRVYKDFRHDDDASASWYVPYTQTYTIRVHLYSGQSGRFIRYRAFTN